MSEEFCPTRGRYVPKGCAIKPWDTKGVVAALEEEERKRPSRDSGGIPPTGYKPEGYTPPGGRW